MLQIVVMNDNLLNVLLSYSDTVEDCLITKCCNFFPPLILLFCIFSELASILVNSVDPDQTAPRRIWVYPVCSQNSVLIFG